MDSVMDEENDNEDPLSDLPQGVIDLILAKLPIKEAVRTSVLSTSWRYRWTFMTHLEFHDEEEINIMEKVLSRHEGPILGISFSTLEYDDIPNILEGMNNLSTRDLREVSIAFNGVFKAKWFPIPSSLFYFSNLTSLKLQGFRISFVGHCDGFPSLKYLLLDHVRVSEGDFKMLISRCPLLESLELVSLYSVDRRLHELRLSALNLKRLTARIYMFYKIVLVDTPCLVDLNLINYYHDEHLPSGSLKCNNHEFHQSAPLLQRLSLEGPFSKFCWHMCTNDMLRQGINQHLQFINLKGIQFNDHQEFLCLLQMAVASPNLICLNIETATRSDTDQVPWFEEDWEENIPSDWSLDNLKRVKIESVSGYPHEAKFMKFLLMHSPKLDLFLIMLSLDHGRVSEAMDFDDFCSDVLSAQVASPNALIRFNVCSPSMYYE